MFNITSAFQDLPEFLTTTHLIELGLYQNFAAAYLARKNGISPSYVRISCRILYPKSAVIEFIEKNLRDGSAKHMMATNKA